MAAFTNDDLALLLARSTKAQDDLAAAVTRMAVAVEERPEPVVEVSAPPPAPVSTPIVQVDPNSIGQAVAASLAHQQQGLQAQLDELAKGMKSLGELISRQPREQRFTGGNMGQTKLLNAAGSVIEPPTLASVEAIETAIVSRLPDLTGTLKLYTGTTGTASVLAGERILFVDCTAGSSAATVTIGLLAAVTVSATRTWGRELYGNVAGAVDIVFTGTASYVVGVLS